MNPNKPLISDEEIKLYTSQEVAPVYDKNKMNKITSVATLIRDRYESHLSTLTTENQSLKEKLGKAVELLKISNYNSDELLKGKIKPLGLENSVVILRYQITSFLKENQL